MSTSYPNLGNTKHREEMDVFQLLNPKRNKVWVSISECGQFWIVDLDYLIQIQRCKQLQSLSQNVGSFWFLNLEFFENFKQQADSLNFFFK